MSKDNNYLFCVAGVSIYFALTLIQTYLPDSANFEASFAGTLLFAGLFLIYISSIIFNICFGFVTMKKYYKLNKLIGFIFGMVTCFVGVVSLFFWIEGFKNIPF